jgi:hypothetical protein
VLPCTDAAPAAAVWRIHHPHSSLQRRRHQAHGALAPAPSIAPTPGRCAVTPPPSPGHSPRGGSSIPASPRGSAYLDAANNSFTEGEGPSGSGSGTTGSDEYEESSQFSESAPGGIGARLVSCLAIMRHDMSLTGEEPAVKSPKGAAVRGGRPPAGVSMQVWLRTGGVVSLRDARTGFCAVLSCRSAAARRALSPTTRRPSPALPPRPPPAPVQRRAPGDDPAACSRCWDEVDATTYSVRSVDYIRTKLKVSSEKAIYRLAGVDVFRTDAKAFHVARLVTLPPARDPVRVGDVALPPLLVFNVQLPQYAAGFFGPSDGLGQSIVYYFALPEDFDPERFGNQAALGLLARFVSNGREADGSSTRERLKMIARVANAEEWAEAAPLSAAEYRLLINYNEKPVLTRPQVHACGGGGRVAEERGLPPGLGQSEPGGSRHAYFDPHACLCSARLF